MLLLSSLLPAVPHVHAADDPVKLPDEEVRTYVYSFGAGGKGRLGHGDFNNQMSPKQIEYFRGHKVKAIAAGSEHTLVLTEAGEVYSFGRGGYGQLGHGDNEDQSLPKKVEALAGIKVKAIAAGDHYSLVLTEAGEVYSFGYGLTGRLGHGDDENQSLPKKIEGLTGIIVKAIAAGGGHSLVLTEAGEVYSFGSGSLGQLGHGRDAHQRSPRQIAGLSDVKAIAAGGLHSLVVTEAGEVYSYGSGYYGQLGHGDTMNQSLPKKMEALTGIEVKAIAAGGMHSLVLTEAGEVYSFGNSYHSQLGHGSRLNEPIPKKIEGLTENIVKEIAAGNEYSLVLTETGEVYSFGLGDSGQLGHGDGRIKPVPEKIQGLSKVSVIAAGLTHSLVLVEEIIPNSSIAPHEATFDKNPAEQQDVVVSLTLNGNELTGIWNGPAQLAAGVDYEEDGSTVTLAKLFLAKLPVGTMTLEFRFTAGKARTLDIM